MTAVRSEQLEELAELACAGGICVLSGAGLSTESGIPDYRGPSGRARPGTPMTFQEFTGSAKARQRYWARSHAGWRTIGLARPNAGHLAVAELQRAAVIAGVITQNVDGLHQAGGATEVLELHGALNRVICLSCAAASSRLELDVRLRAANPELAVANLDEVRPDGDTALSEAEVAEFRMVDCLDCGTGILKPDVTFFGEFLPPARVERSYELVGSARTLLVLGSSLTVASGFRFVRRAISDGIDLAIVNQGETRGDKYARVKIDAPLGDVLAGLTSSVRATQSI